MKKLMLSLAAIALLQLGVVAQTQLKELETAVVKLDNAKEIRDYQALAHTFYEIAESNPGNWQSWYYAAFCNAKIGWLYEDDGEQIESFSDQAKIQINKCISLLDTLPIKKN